VNAYPPAMGKRTGVDRDRELAKLAAAAAEIAARMETQGEVRAASHYWAVATFLLDCMRTRPPSFRGSGTRRGG
jgi:hypothetical protein